MIIDISIKPETLSTTKLRTILLACYPWTQKSCFRSGGYSREGLISQYNTGLTGVYKDQFIQNLKKFTLPT